MTISKDKFRREVHLTKEILDMLQELADDDGRSLKNLMETILIRETKQMYKNKNKE